MFKAYVILMSITFIELAVGLTILRVPYSVFIAGIIAIVDILPVLGTGTVLIPWALISLIQGKYTFAAGIAVIYIVITVVRSMLEPRFVGRQIGFNPVVTLIMMYLGLQVLGFAGLFLFPLTMIVLKAAQDANLVSIWK
jgi:sporulation integral membrane protein YtvI